MSLYLHYGHAGPAYTQRLLENLRTQNSQSLVITPHLNQARALQALLINESVTSPLVPKISILTLDHFLTSILKHNRPRVHQAENLFCKCLLMGLIEKDFPHLKTFATTPAESAEHFYALFSAFGTAGLDPTDISHYNKHLPDASEKLFAAYLDKLNEGFYFDEAGRYREVILGLEKRKFSLPLNQSLHFWGFYPLHAGHRRLIAALQMYTDIIHIYYSEKYNRSDDLLSLAFQELGIQCDTSYDLPKSDHTPEWISCRNIHDEVDAISEQIKKNGPIKIIAPNVSYALHISEGLRTKNISSQIGFAIPAADLLPQEKERAEQLIHAHFMTQNFFLQLKLKAHTAWQKKMADLNFSRQVLQSLGVNLAEITVQELQQHEHTKFHIHPEYSEIVSQIVPLNHAHLPASSSRIWLAGFTSEYFTLPPETPFAALQAANKSCAELLSSPSLRTALTVRRIEQLLENPNTMCVSTTEIDLKLKPTLILPPLFTEQNFKIRTPILHTKAKDQKLTREVDFFKTKKRHFRVTELQKYLDCPYQYYAAYHLKLGDLLDEDELTPKSSDTGTLAHLVWHRLVKENETDYLEGLEYVSFRKRLIKPLLQIISEEAGKIEHWKSLPSAVTDFFQKRLFYSLYYWIEKESEYYIKEKKRTTVKYTEWAFGNSESLSKNNQALELKTGDHVFQIRGRIDRIDINRNLKTFSIIDYKTGTPPSATDILECREIQLLLYLIAVQRLLLQDYQPSGVFYYDLKEGKIIGLATKEGPDSGTCTSRHLVEPETWNSLSKKALAKAEQAIQGIQSGKFAPNPRTASLCHSCPYRGICGFKAGKE